MGQHIGRFLRMFTMGDETFETFGDWCSFQKSTRLAIK